MEKHLKFSVIIPVYNVESYLDICLNSVIDQTLKDIEIICVNDGSTDGSVEVLEKYRRMDSRITIVNKANGGLASARNAGLRAATGDYIMFLDPDDYLNTNACDRLYYEVLSTRPDVIIFGADIFPAYPEPDEWLTNNLSPRKITYYDDSVKALVEEDGAYPYVWRNCYKSSFLSSNSLTFEESIKFAEDTIFQFCAFPCARSLDFIADKIYNYRYIRENSLMNNASKDIFGKYQYHVEAVRDIALFWKEHGFLDRYPKEFFKWTLDFLGFDFCNYEGYGKDLLMKKTCDIWKEFDLDKYSSKLSRDERQYYKRFQSVSRHYSPG